MARIGKRKQYGAFLVAVVAMLSLEAPPAAAADRIQVTGTAVSTPAGEVVREIDDLHTGDRWFLVRDNEHPGGPGRMVLATGPEARPAAGTSPLRPALRQPVVRNGDRVVIEEDTAVVHARFEAVALGSAMEGGQFNARMTAGGKIVHVVALGARRAAFAPESNEERWP